MTSRLLTVFAILALAPLASAGEKPNTVSLKDSVYEPRTNKPFSVAGRIVHVGSVDKKGTKISSITCPGHFYVHVIPEIAKGRRQVDFAIMNDFYDEIDSPIVATITDAAGVAHGTATMTEATLPYLEDGAMFALRNLPPTGDLTLTFTVPGVDCFTPQPFTITRVKGSTALDWWSSGTDRFLSPHSDFLQIWKEGLWETDYIRAVSCQNLKTGSGTIIVRSSGTLGSGTVKIRFKDICDVMPGWSRSPTRTMKFPGGQVRVISSKYFWMEELLYVDGESEQQTFKTEVRFAGVVKKKSFAFTFCNDGMHNETENGVKNCSVGSGSGGGGGNGGGGGSGSGTTASPVL